MNNKLEKDNWLYRMVVVASALDLFGQSTPEVIVALRSVAIGGLAGLLAPSPLNR